MRKGIFFIFILALSGCALTSSKHEVNTGPYVKIFKGQYDDIWRAAQKVLIDYPIRVNNSETGILQTDSIKGSKAFVPPHSDENYSSGYRYRLLVRMARGSNKKDPAVKVTVSKDIEIQRDFFAKPEPINSDGLEEKVILYRMEREILIDKAIKKANSQ